MENNPGVTNVNTPSKLRPPKARKTLETLSEVVTVEAAGKIEAEVPPMKRYELPAMQSSSSKTGATDRLSAGVKIYKTEPVTTTRPPAVRTHARPAPRTAAQARLPLPSKSSSTIPTGVWEQRTKLSHLKQEVEGLRETINAVSMAPTLSSVNAGQIGELSSRVTVLEEERNILQTRLLRKESELLELEETIQKLRKNHELVISEKDSELLDVRKKHRSELEAMAETLCNAKHEANNLRSDLNIKNSESEALRNINSKQSVILFETEEMSNTLRVRIADLESQLDNLSRDKSILQITLSTTTADLDLAKKKIQEGEALRRRLHNMVQELKGNIRVFCRVRPFLACEAGFGSMEYIKTGTNTDEIGEITITQASESASGQAITKPYSFTFDRVFGQSASQEDVFDEISQLVQSSLDGYRVCIFAYGQTGSGKTFTMEGNTSDPSNAGMIPKSVEQIFATAEAMSENGWKFSFECSYLEIYNETIRDLLSTRRDQEGRYDIRHHEGRTTVTDLTIAPVTEGSEIIQLLSRAASSRAVAETQCNERSSRSHSVFTLKISGCNSVTTECIEGLLNLIDLAGSERLGQSGSTGDRLKETQAINKSLSSLGDVIHALANKDSHIPYRNSKLTYLLQNSLGGNGKTLMFVNVSPVQSSLGETLCSLRFAAKVNACQIGTARKITK